MTCGGAARPHPDPGHERPLREQGYCTQLMIEVDELSVESNLESHRISFEWARRNLAEAMA